MSLDHRSAAALLRRRSAPPKMRICPIRRGGCGKRSLVHKRLRGERGKESYMEFVELQSERHPWFSQAMALYARSFPRHEQRREASQRSLFAQPAYHFAAISEQGEFAGLMLYWESAQFLYVEHFCVLESLRGCGCGSRALQLLQKKGKTIILEIDPPVDDLTRRRQAFYLRAGFLENSYAHVHPPYHQDCKGHALQVLSWPRMLTQQQYAEFAAYLQKTVMRGALA